MKGEIQADKFPLNKYEMFITGVGRILFTAITGLEEALDVVDLPDRTRSSGGRTQPLEFEVQVPAHHRDDILKMERWFRENRDPVLPTGKKAVTVTMISDSRLQTLTANLLGVFPRGRTIPDLDRTNDGEAAMFTYAMSADEVLAVVFA